MMTTGRAGVGQRIAGVLAWVVVAGVLTLMATPSRGATVADIARIKGQGEVLLQGLGLVVGLNGTGDSGSELIMARPLMQLLTNNGNQPGSIDELESSQSVALVMVTCVVPPIGAKADDKIDVRVSTIHSASSLEGGTLYIAPLTLPSPNSPTFAFAEGQIYLSNPDVPTNGIVRQGARVAMDIDTTPAIERQFDLIVNQHFAGWSSVGTVADTINQEYWLQRNAADLRPPATVIDPRTIRVRIPEEFDGQIVEFIRVILSSNIDSALLGLPARVVVNQELGSIVITGDVKITPTVITHRDLVITTTVPEVVPAPDQPRVEQTRFAQVGTGLGTQDRARLSDLINAFKQLNIPTDEQIQILQMLHKAGQLHAQFVID